MCNKAQSCSTCFNFVSLYSGTLGWLSSHPEAVMYAIHKQTHPSTGIEHAIYCNFFSPREKNLVTAGVNQLHVYRLFPDVEVRNFMVWCV